MPLAEFGDGKAQHLAAPAPSPELQLIYETAPIGLAFLTPDCRYVLINQRLTEICGLSVADHIGRSVRETVPQVAAQVEQIVAAILRTGGPITGVEVNGQRPDNANAERVWITYWHPLKDRDGVIVGINVAAEEITERKRAQAALAASEERFRKLAETLAQRVAAQARERDRIWNVSQDLLAVSGSDGRLLSINPAWTATLGWTEDELTGKTAEWLLHPDDLERSRTELASLIEGRKTTHFDNRLRHKCGSYRWLSWQAVPDQGLIYSVARDVTDLKQADERLRALRRELAQVSGHATMGATTASIAHELNQPLGAIVMNGNAGLRWLAMPEPDLAEVRGALMQVVSDGLRSSEVIASIRGMFGMERRERKLVNINVLIKEVVALARTELESHQVSLQLEMDSGLPEVMAERVQLQQVLLNLIMNAIEAMGSVTDRARVLRVTSGLQTPDDLFINVEDSGAGIDPTEMDRIFDAFFSTKAHGMGIGLAICRSIIGAHNGQLWASSGAEHGAIFHIVLPISPA
jgi:PAS domain S-box-containing protein